MSNLSKMITDRVKSADSVLAAIAAHKTNIKNKIQTLYTAGDAAQSLLEKVADHLKAQSEKMQEADLLHAKELADDDALLTHRDTATEALRTELIKLRKFINGNFSSNTASSLGFDGPTPDDPMAVQRLGALVAEQLLNVDLGTPSYATVQINVEDLATNIQVQTKTLSEAMDKVVREKREAEASLLLKRQALAYYDQTFSLTANLLSTLLQTAGEKELARRVRPSGRRPGQTVEIAGGSAEHDAPAPIPVSDPQ